MRFVVMEKRQREYLRATKICVIEGAINFQAEKTEHGQGSRVAWGRTEYRVQHCARPIPKTSISDAWELNLNTCGVLNEESDRPPRH